MPEALTTIPSPSKFSTHLCCHCNQPPLHAEPSQCLPQLHPSQPDKSFILCHPLLAFSKPLEETLPTLLMSKPTPLHPNFMQSQWHPTSQHSECITQLPNLLQVCSNNSDVHKPKTLIILTPECLTEDSQNLDPSADVRCASEQAEQCLGSA